MSFLPRLRFHSIVEHYWTMVSVHLHPEPLQRIVAAENQVKYRSSTGLVLIKYRTEKLPVDFQVVEREQE